MKTQYNNYPIKNNIILFSKGEFSQWYGGFKGQDDGGFTVGDKTLKFNCAEQAMMYYKACLFKDDKSKQKIMNESHPSRQKDLGREISNFNPNIWDRHKEHIIYQINVHKFSKNPRLRQLLLGSYPYILCEAAPWDKIWGNGLPIEDDRSYNVDTWIGQNLLGKALMLVRSKLLITEIFNSDIIL